MSLSSLPKTILRPLLPPFLVHTARYLLKNRPRVPSHPPQTTDIPTSCAAPSVEQLAGSVNGESPTEWEYVPDGFTRRDPAIQGWNVESILKTQMAKWPRFLELVRGTGPLAIAHEAPKLSDADFGAHNTIMAFAYVLALASRKKDVLSLLDWGSGIGHYFEISQAVLPDVRLEYHAMDVPVLARGGRALVPGAVFHEDEADCFARSYDLVVASSSLQYSEDWRETTRRLTEATRSYLYITRLPVVREAPSFPVVQRPARYGYRTEYVGWFLNRGEFLRHVAGLGMELVREFLIYERPTVHGAPEQGEYRGFLFRPRRGRNPA